MTVGQDDTPILGCHDRQFVNQSSQILSPGDAAVCMKPAHATTYAPRHATAYATRHDAITYQEQ